MQGSNACVYRAAERPHQHPREPRRGGSGATLCWATLASLLIATLSSHSPLIRRPPGFLPSASFPPAASGFAPFPPAEALPFLYPGSRRSPPRRNRVPPSRPLCQDRGWLRAHALDGADTIRDHAEPRAGACRVIIAVGPCVTTTDGHSLRVAGECAPI